MLPRYPVYIPSKGRFQKARALTARTLIRDGVPFKLVVEPSEAEAYAAQFGEARLLVLPENGLKLVGSRNWIKAHSVASGAARHWQLDDNIRGWQRRFRRKRLPCRAGVCLRMCEDFTDRFEHVALSGLNYSMFAIDERPKPFRVNVHVYSCTLVNNAMPYGWRLVYNDDTDICLQALSGGWNTILVCAFLADKVRTMNVGGGNTDSLYQGDGRLVMARSLERVWPGIVTTIRRFGRPQHWVDWKKFRQPLRVKEGVTIPAGVDELGLRLVQAKSRIKSDRLRGLMEAHGALPGAVEGSR